MADHHSELDDGGDVPARIYKPFYSKDGGYLIGSCLAATPPAAPAPPAFGETVEVDLVTIEMGATDRAGQPVAGLDLRDFQLLEDGKPVEITHFAPISPIAPVPASLREAAATPAPGEATGTTGPTHLLVYVDDQRLRPAHRARVLRQIVDFSRAHPVRQVEVPVTRQEVLTAFGKYFRYNLTLRLPPGRQRVAVAVRDELGATASYLARNVDVVVAGGSAR